MTTGWAATALALPPGEACAAFAPGEASLQVPTLSTRDFVHCEDHPRAHARDVWPHLDNSTTSRTWPGAQMAMSELPLPVMVWGMLLGRVFCAADACLGIPMLAAVRLLEDVLF